MSEKYEQQVKEFQRMLQQRIKFLDEQKNKKEKEQVERMVKRVSEYLENLTVKEEPEQQPKKWYRGRVRKR
jgi:hypothetical protein